MPYIYFPNIFFIFYLLNDVRRYNYSKRSTVRYNYMSKEMRRVHEELLGLLPITPKIFRRGEKVR